MIIGRFRLDFGFYKKIQIKNVKYVILNISG